MKNLYRAERKNWDAYNAFHSTSWPFVDFESGHVSLDSHRYSPAYVRVRKTYPAREVAIVDTTGRGYSGRIVYKDPATGAVVPVAQLSYAGIATFLIDLKTGRAYSTLGGPPKITISRGYVDVSTCAAQPAVREACDAASLLYKLAAPTASFSYAQNSIDLAASRFGRYESSYLPYYADKVVNNTAMALFRNIVIGGVPNSSVQLADDIATGKITEYSYQVWGGV